MAKKMTSQEKRVAGIGILGTALLLGVGLLSNDYRNEKPAPPQKPAAERVEVIQIPKGCPVYTGFFHGSKERVIHYFIHETHYEAYKDAYKFVRVEVPEMKFKGTFDLKERQVGKQTLPSHFGMVGVQSSGYDMKVYGIDDRGKETIVYDGMLPPQIKGDHVRIRTGRDK